MSDKGIIMNVCVNDEFKAEAVIDSERIVVRSNNKRFFAVFRTLIRNYDEVKNYYDVAEFCADAVVYMLQLKPYAEDNPMDLCQFYNYFTLCDFIDELVRFNCKSKIVFDNSGKRFKIVVFKVGDTTFIFKLNKKGAEDDIGVSILQVKISTLVGSINFPLSDMCYQDIEKLVRKFRKLFGFSEQGKLTRNGISLLLKDVKHYSIKADEDKSEIASSGLKLIALKYNNKTVGYRFEVNDKESYDISLSVAKQYGVVSSKVSESMELQEHDGLFLSKKEIDSGNLVTEISNDKILVDRLFKNLQSKQG